MKTQNAMHGWSESTPAMRAILGSAFRGGARKVRRKARSAVKRVKALARGARRKTRAKAKGKAAKFVKGSVAAKRHMAKLRKLASKARGR